MPGPFLDRVFFSAASPGVGTFTQAFAITGYQTMQAAGAVDGARYHYLAQSADLTQWEYGSGTWTLGTTTLSRDTIIRNSLGGTSPINFTAAPQVMIAILAEDLDNPSVVDKGSVGTGTVTFDVSVATKQKLTVTGPLAIAFTGWPANLVYAELFIHLVNAGTNITGWSGVQWLKGDGTYSTTFSTMGVTLNNAGSNWINVWSDDGGINLWGRAA